MPLKPASSWPAGMTKEKLTQEVNDALAAPFPGVEPPKVAESPYRYAGPKPQFKESAVVSLASGAAVEAAVFGVPALFLSPEARGLFPDLLARGLARLLEVQNLNDTIADLPAPPTRPLFVHAPDLDETLAQIEAMVHMPQGWSVV